MGNVCTNTLRMSGSEEQLEKIEELLQEEYGDNVELLSVFEDGNSSEMELTFDSSNEIPKELLKEITDSIPDTTGLYIRVIGDEPATNYLEQFIFKGGKWSFENTTQDLDKTEKQINNSRTFENIVTSFFYYMWNTWGTEDEIKVVFPEEHLHFTSKWQAYFEVYGTRASENFYSQLTPDNRERLVNRACELYDGRTKIINP